MKSKSINKVSAVTSILPAIKSKLIQAMLAAAIIIWAASDFVSELPEQNNEPVKIHQELIQQAD